MLMLNIAYSQNKLFLMAQQVPNTLQSDEQRGKLWICSK